MAAKITSLDVAMPEAWNENRDREKQHEPPFLSEKENRIGYRVLFRRHSHSEQELLGVGSSAVQITRNVIPWAPNSCRFAKSEHFSGPMKQFYLAGAASPRRFRRSRK